MPRNNENLNDSAKCAVTSRTPQRNKGKKLFKVKELQEQLKQARLQLEEEKRCKNEAYYFVLSSGYFKKFAEFHKNHRANLDYHGACLAQLYLDSFENK